MNPKSIILLLIIFRTTTLTSQVDLDHGLLGYWPLDSSAINQSLNQLPNSDLDLSN